MDEIRILAYLRGKLSPTERESFESEIASNPELAAQIKVQEKLIQALRNENYQQLLHETKAYSAVSPAIKALKEKLASPKENEISVPLPLSGASSSPRTLIKRLAPWLAAAAAVIILFFTGSIFISLYMLKQTASNNGPTQIFIKKASIEDDILKLNQAIDSIRSNHMKGALTHLSLINEQSKAFINAQYLSGYCNYKLGNYKTALTHLAKIKGRENQLDLLFNDYESVDKNHVDWLKALCFLGNGQKSNALKIINKIMSKKEHPYYQNALKLKRKI